MHAVVFSTFFFFFNSKKTKSPNPFLVVFFVFSRMAICSPFFVIEKKKERYLAPNTMHMFPRDVGSADAKNKRPNNSSTGGGGLLNTHGERTHTIYENNCEGRLLAAFSNRVQ